MNRQQEFAEQLKRDDLRTVNELLNNPDWRWLREFYKTHLDEILGLLNRKNLRTVVEDYCRLAPESQSKLMESRLFIYQVNLALFNGCLTQDKF